ncbi:ABC transporter ATP-binding protein [Mucilaginibacter roseus]|uniref:ABC transporter ATP-binding protein n=1 Tax=Mucilaginibacter roseus TaxID=1528868 RepID=A0ABS8U4M8_9SPHI|nr:ABC transporter ATP-binding protein [Mucilaginibacter roseus]MCD8742061.1 ABC transporter ATP-binding protein [Mucilaginibacter roseus]
MHSHTLKVDSVQLEFDDRKILQDVFLSCSTGEVVGLLGRNGCGKSSLLRIIFGSLNCGYKHVSVDGQHISKGYHKNRIAYLPQHNYLPSGIKICKLAKPFVDPLLWSNFSDHPAYQQHRYKTVGELSGGELRQLETLMIVYSRADFILLDEPFTHISPVQADTLKTLVKTCAKTKGIIVTDHQYYNVLGVSDRIILLDNGCTRPIKDDADLVTYNYLNKK